MANEAVVKEALKLPSVRRVRRVRGTLAEELEARKDLQLARKTMKRYRRALEELAK